MQTKKITLLVVAIVISIISLGFMGFRAFTTKVMDSRSCEWANIDNIELRAKVDIPDVTDCDCKYSEFTDTKKSIFILDKEEVNFAAYVVKNNFKKVGDKEKLPIEYFTFENDAKQFENTKPLYYREGFTKWESYKMILNTETGKLWVYLKYMD